jgi:hypothetical protein
MIIGINPGTMIKVSQPNSLAVAVNGKGNAN